MIENVFSLNSTLTLLQAIEKVKPPITFLADTLFPEVLQVQTDYVAVETLKHGTRLAPYIVAGSKGIDVAREKSRVQTYRPPMIGARRTISYEDIAMRQFAEQPNIYNSTPLETRQAQLQARDLADLLRLHSNRRGQMAAELIQTGKITVKAYADDGKVTEDNVIDYGFENISEPAVHWDNPAATIYADLLAASEQIQADFGELPTLAICGKNVEKYLLANTEIKNWLMLPNRENLLMASLQPQFSSPQVRYIGTINSLNLELVSYSQIYTDDLGVTKPLINPDTVIVTVPKIGREIHTPIPAFIDNDWRNFSSAYLPLYTANTTSQTTALTVLSRYLFVPDDISSWFVIKTRG